ncbi:MAG: 3-deoxy-8-phosphooctulonate synthase [Elusimicrobiota bacterium]
MPKPRSFRVEVGSVVFDNSEPLSFIAGPCALESEKILRQIGGAIKKNLAEFKTGFVLKSSFDKANRTSLSSYRGPGLEDGLQTLSRVGRDLGVPVITDVHEPAQAAIAARYVDILQIPAFLCRQTDLLLACGKTGKAVNIKKGQFLSPWDIINAIKKIESTGNRRILVTERGTTFGYANLVVDMRGLEIMRGFGYPVIYDATHSVQLPGGLGHATAGERKYAEPLARAAAAVGVAGIFFETHPRPEEALSDGPNSIALKDAGKFIRITKKIDALIKRRTR